MKIIQTMFGKLLGRHDIKQDFGQAACKIDEPISVNMLIDMVKAERVDLQDAMFYVPGHGNSANTVLTENEVFKGPKHDNSFDKRDLAVTEYGNLKAVGGRGLPVPEVTCVSKDKLFYGMTRMPGIYCKDLETPLTEIECAQLGIDIARAAHGISACFPPPSDKEPDLKKAAGFDMAVFDAPGVKQILGDKFDFCRGQITAFLQRSEGRKPVMMLSDVHDKNVLIDPVSRKLTAVLDFGSVSYQHPEIAGVFSYGSFPDAVARSACAEYSKLRPEVDIRDWMCMPTIRMLRHISDPQSMYYSESKNNIGPYLSSFQNLCDDIAAPKNTQAKEAKPFRPGM